MGFRHDHPCPASTHHGADAVMGIDQIDRGGQRTTSQSDRALRSEADVSTEGVLHVEVPEWAI
jgi:hypothetical protein